MRATFNDIAEALAVPLVQVALAWVLRRPGVISAILGARNLEQLDDELQAATLRLPNEQAAALDAASNVPMGYPTNLWHVSKALGNTAKTSQGHDSMASTPIIGQLGTAAAPKPTHVIDVTEQTFEHDVLEASFERPVVIDFWATWCGPCKQLSPVLEQLAEEGGGQWVLAKIDVDGAPRLAQYFQAQSIPMVLAIFQGQLVSQFAGALPKREVERWLGDVFKRSGLELVRLTEPEVPSDPDKAIAFHRQRLAQHPADTKAKLALGRLLFAKGEVAAADVLLSEIPFGAPEYNAARAALALKELMAEIGAAGGEAAVRQRHAANPDDVDETYLLGLVEGTSGRFAAGLSLLIGQVAARLPPEVKARAKKAAAMLLEAAGRGDAEVEAERKRLTRLLF